MTAYIIYFEIGITWVIIINIDISLIYVFNIGIQFINCLSIPVVYCSQPENFIHKNRVVSVN